MAWLFSEASSSTYFVLQKFVDDVDKRRRDVDEIRAKASELLPQLSQHDTELVEEHIRWIHESVCLSDWLIDCF